jgi:hypothetical protein
LTDFWLIDRLFNLVSGKKISCSAPGNGLGNAWENIKMRHPSECSRDRAGSLALRLIFDYVIMALFPKTTVRKERKTV